MNRTVLFDIQIAVFNRFDSFKDEGGVISLSSLVFGWCSKSR